MPSERVALYITNKYSCNLVASNLIGNMYSNSNAVVTREIRCKKLEERKERIRERERERREHEVNRPDRA